MLWGAEDGDAMRLIDADSLLEHARRKQLKYSDEQSRQTAWWFIHKFLPALVAEEPEVTTEGLECEND